MKFQNTAALGLALLAVAAPNFAQSVKKIKAVKKIALALITVTPRIRAEVAGAVFTLGEIAEFSGKDAALIVKIADGGSRDFAASGTVAFAFAGRYCGAATGEPSGDGAGGFDGPAFDGNFVGRTRDWKARRW